LVAGGNVNKSTDGYIKGRIIIIIVISMSATTTAIFTALGIPWATIYATFQGAVATAGQVLLDIFLALWPLWLGIGVLLFVIGIPWYLYHRATKGR